MNVRERFQDMFGSGADHPQNHDEHSHGQEGGSPDGAQDGTRTEPLATDEPRAFEDVREEFEFTGYTDSQQEVILDQLEQVWETDSGRSMLEAGLNGPGLHYLNVNDQGVISSVAPRIGMTADGVPDIGNFALPSRGEIFLNAYDALDANGDVQVYSGLDPALDGQSATAKDPIRSLDTNGEVFTVPPLYTMIHESNHVARNEPDIPRNRPAGVEYDASMTGTTSLEAAQAYAGLNEVSTREILTEMGLDQQRGAYNAAGGLDNSDPGTDYGLGRPHDVGVTSARETDMTGHSAVDAVVIDSLTQDVLDSFGASSRTDLLDHTFKMGDRNDTVHAFDGDDTVTLGGGDDRGFAGLGDDTFNAGRGNDTYDGGDANLDPASDHRSDAATDWGFDTVSYTTLPDSFAPPEIDGTRVDGVVISVSANEITVDKGIPYAPQLTGDVDTLNNIDRVVGTDRDDVAVVDGFADGTVLSGGGGTNRLDISTMPSGEVTHTPGAIGFNGVMYGGVIEHDGRKLYYEDYSVEDGRATGEADAGLMGEGTSASGRAGETQTLNMTEAAAILDASAAGAVDAARESGDPAQAATSELLEEGGAAAMVLTLHKHGETIEMDRSVLENGSQAEQAEAVVRGMSERVTERGLESEVVSQMEKQAESEAERAAQTSAETSADAQHLRDVPEHVAEHVHDDASYDYAL